MKYLLIGLFILSVSNVQAQLQTGVFRTSAGNTDYHQFSRTGSGAAVFINQTDSIHPILRLSSRTATANAGVVFTVENTGNVGIGTTAPSSRLSVLGGISVYSDITNTMERPVVSAGTIAGEIRGVSQQGPAMDDGFLRLSAGGGSDYTSKSYIDLSGYLNSIYTTEDRYKNITMGTSGVERLRIISNGNVGIGTTNPTEKLSVKGNIKAQEIKVTTAAGDWPDCVFDKGYPLPSLDSLESQIKITGHLPGMPSARDIEKDGLSIGQIIKQQQQKIEELVLYLVDQQKEIKALKLQLQGLKNRNEK